MIALIEFPWTVIKHLIAFTFANVFFISYYFIFGWVPKWVTVSFTKHWIITQQENVTFEE